MKKRELENRITKQFLLNEGQPVEDTFMIHWRAVYDLLESMLARRTSDTDRNRLFAVIQHLKKMLLHYKRAEGWKTSETDEQLATERMGVTGFAAVPGTISVAEEGKK